VSLAALIAGGFPVEDLRVMLGPNYPIPEGVEDAPSGARSHHQSADKEARALVVSEPFGPAAERNALAPPAAS
jgi:hypothetical protein